MTMQSIGKFRLAGIACSAILSLLIGSCQSPVISSGSVGGVAMTLSVSGPAISATGNAISRSTSSRWLNPAATYATATLNDSGGKLLVSAKGYLVARIGGMEFQIDGVKPGNGYTLNFNLYQDATLAVILGTATVTNLNIQIGKNQAVGISVLPVVAGGNDLGVVGPSQSPALTSSITKFELSNSGPRALIFYLATSSQTLKIVDQNGLVVGQSNSAGLAGNVVYVWDNSVSSGTPLQYYAIVGTGNGPFSDNLNISLDMGYLPYDSVNFILSWTAVNPSGPGGITYQVLRGNGTSPDINAASVVADNFTGTSVPLILTTGQFAWVKYRLNGQMMGLLGYVQR